MNKLRKWKRLSQTFGKLFSKFWSKLPSSSAAGNFRERFLERNSSSIVSRNFCWSFLDVRQQVSVGLSKLRFSCPEENREGCFRSKTFFLEIPKCEQLFSNIFATVFQQFVKMLNSSCSDKNIAAKNLFSKKSHIFSNHFQLQSKVFRTFEQLFSSGLSNLTFVSPDKFSLGKWVSFGKSSPWNFFRNLLEPRLDFLLIFSAGTSSKMQSTCPKHLSRKNFL